MVHDFDMMMIIIVPSNEAGAFRPIDFSERLRREEPGNFSHAPGDRPQRQPILLGLDIV
jgi:hypothetical protein